MLKPIFKRGYPGQLTGFVGVGGWFISKIPDGLCVTKSPVLLALKVAKKFVSGKMHCGCPNFGQLLPLTWVAKMFWAR